MLRTSIGIVILLLSVTGALAQPAKKAEEHARILLQNDQIAVREQVWAPASKTAPANFPNSFIYPLTDGTLVITHPGRTPFEMSFRAGEALWLPAQATALANEGDKEIRALVVEIKEKPVGSGRSRGKPATAQPATAKGKKSSQTP